MLLDLFDFINETINETITDAILGHIMKALLGSMLEWLTVCGSLVELLSDSFFLKKFKIFFWTQ